jgi:hypothetical protein
VLEPEIHPPAAAEAPEELADDGNRAAVEFEPEELDPAELADDGNRLVADADPEDAD